MSHSKEDIQRLIEFTHKSEGGLSRDHSDSASSYPNPLEYQGQTGWHTNKGITFKVWEKNYPNNPRGFFTMTDDQFLHIFEKGFWDKIGCNQIDSFGVAAYYFGFAWGSGPYIAGLLLQKAVCNVCKPIAIDGAVGPKTLAAVNECDPTELFDNMVEMRAAFFHFIGDKEYNSPHNLFMEELSKKKTRSGRNLISRNPTNGRFVNGWMNRLRGYVEQFRPQLS